MPGFLVWLAIDAVLMLAAHFISKALPIDKNDPGSIEPPSADPSRPIPVVWGTAKVQPNVFWWGNTDAREFTKKGQAAGFTYYAAMAMGICWGPIDALVDIIFDNRRSIKISPATITPTLPRNKPGGGLGEDYVLVADNLFGGSEKEGGVRGKMGFYYGTAEQWGDWYLVQETEVGGLPTESDHKRLAYAVFKWSATENQVFGWGTTANIKPVHFVVRRCPAGANGAGTATINGHDANPAEIIYEILTDTWWGLRMATADIDLASFQAAAVTLSGEGFGISMIANGVPGTDTIQEVLRYIDGAVYTDPVTGKIAMSLVRKDYTEGTLPVVNSDNGHSFEFSRPTFRELATGVKVKFTNKERNYQEDIADWQNQATLEVTAEESIEEIDMLGITDKTLAAKMAYRVGKALTLPFARVNFKTNRNAFNWVKSKPFMLNVPEENIGPLVMRVMEIDYGSLENGEIGISAVEDVFFTGGANAGGYAPPVVGIDTPAPLDGSIVPQIIEDLSLTDTLGTLDVDILDPNSRVTLVEKRTKVGNAAYSGWTTWVAPYVVSVDRAYDFDSLIEYRISYTAVDGDPSQLLGDALVDRLGTRYQPDISVLLVDSSRESVTYQINSTEPEGLPVTIYYAFGDDPYTLTVANGGTIVVPRSVNDADEKFLRLKAVAGNGLTQEKNIIVDYDVVPEIVTVADPVPVFTGNVQTGWRISGTVDDDTRALVITVTGALAFGSATPVGTVESATVYWSNTTSTKSFDIILTQAIGESGTLTLTPREFYNTADGGLSGFPYVRQIRRPGISSHVIRDLSPTIREIQLSVNPPTATIYYRIGGTGAFSQYPPPETPFTRDVEAASQILEYYSVSVSGAQEDIKRVVIDQNAQPGFIDDPLFSEEGANNARVIVGLDDDVVAWAMWARRGAWPTRQSSSNPLDWQPDNLYLRYEGGYEQTTVDFRAGGVGVNWYIIVRAYDSVGSYSEYSNTLAIAGAAPTLGALFNVASFRNTETGVGYHDLTWENNSLVEGGGYTVTIKEDGVELVSGRDARWEHNTSSNGVANFGGYHISKLLRNPGDPDSVYLEFSYSIELFAGAVSQGPPYTAAIAGWYGIVGGGGGGGSVPSETPGTPTTTALPGGVRATWANTNNSVPIHVYWETSATEFGSYTPVLTVNVNPATDTLDYPVAGVWVRCRLQYYNDIGDAVSYSAYSNGSRAIVVPSEIPASVQTQGTAGYQARSAWTNTSSEWAMDIEFWVNPSGPPATYAFDQSDTAAAGATNTGYHGFDLGDLVKSRVRYTNAAGAGPWSGFSSAILMHA